MTQIDTSSLDLVEAIDEKKELDEQRKKGPNVAIARGIRFQVYLYRENQIEAASKLLIELDNEDLDYLRKKHLVKARKELSEAANKLLELKNNLLPAPK